MKNDAPKIAKPRLASVKTKMPILKTETVTGALIRPGMRNRAASKNAAGLENPEIKVHVTNRESKDHATNQESIARTMNRETKIHDTNQETKVPVMEQKSIIHSTKESGKTLREENEWWSKSTDIKNDD